MFYLRLLFSARGKVLNNFEIRLFPIKCLNKILTHEPTPELPKETKEPTKHKKSKLKLQQEFMNKNIADEKDINDELFWKYFKYQNPSFLAEDLT